MTEQHIERTIDVLIKRCQKLNAASDSNPRYLDDIHETFDRLANYYFIARMQRQSNPIMENNIEYIYERYRNNRADVFIPS